MKTITIRFKDGDEKGWTLHEAMDMGDLARNFASANGSGEIGFGVASEAEDAGSADYGFVGLRMEDVTYWHID